MTDEDFIDEACPCPDHNTNNLDEFVFQIPHMIRDSEMYERLHEDHPVEQNSDETSPLENQSSQHDISEISGEDHPEEQNNDQDYSNEEGGGESSHDEDNYIENNSEGTGPDGRISHSSSESEDLEETVVDHSKDLKHFTCFGTLPPELRVKVWSYTFPNSRIVKLVSHNNRDIVPTQPPASVFHTCRESRKEAQKSFKWKFNTYVSRSEEMFLFEKVPGLRALANLWKRHRDNGFGERIDHAIIEWDVLATLMYEEFDEQLNDLIFDVLPETRLVTILIDPYIIRKGEVSLGETYELYPEKLREFIDRVEDITNAWSDTPPSSPTTDSSQESGNLDSKKHGLKIETKVIKRDGISWPAMEVDPSYTDLDSYFIRLQTELWHKSLIHWIWPRDPMRLY